ncbi:MAG: DUF190 domain-containing protein [Zetaproteobacteria bacterium]|nr:MAG: DUF190 domain-containing protein [Zetaproteobacteria bacterium]
MKPGKCLRIYLTESDRIDGRPALEAVLDLCRQAGLSGVTVTRAIEGLGSHGVHSASFLSLSNKLPLLVEAVDQPETIDMAIETMRPHLGNRLLATWPVEIMRTGEPNA